MAFQTVTRDEHNVIGNLREDYGRFTAGDTNGEVRTRLRWIEAVEIHVPGVGLQSLTVYVNTQDTTENDPDNGGVFHFENTTAAVVHRFRAIGR